MFFARPYKKAILSVLTACPLFKEKWFLDYKTGDKLTFAYNAFQTDLEKITGGDFYFEYEKNGTFTAMVTFPFLEKDARFSRVTAAVDAFPDYDLDDVAIFAERNRNPEPRSVLIITMKDVTKETVEKAAKRLCEAVTDFIEAYQNGTDEE